MDFILFSSISDIELGMKRSEDLFQIQCWKNLLLLKRKKVNPTLNLRPFCSVVTLLEHQILAHVDIVGKPLQWFKLLSRKSNRVVKGTHSILNGCNIWIVYIILWKRIFSFVSFKKNMIITMEIKFKNLVQTLRTVMFFI